jgi:hypothetical protein
MGRLHEKCAGIGDPRTTGIRHEAQIVPSGGRQEPRARRLRRVAEFDDANLLYRQKGASDCRKLRAGFALSTT